MVASKLWWVFVWTKFSTPFGSFHGAQCSLWFFHYLPRRVLTSQFLFINTHFVDDLIQIQNSMFFFTFWRNFWSWSPAKPFLRISNFPIQLFAQVLHLRSKQIHYTLPIRKTSNFSVFSLVKYSSTCPAHSKTFGNLSHTLHGPHILLHTLAYNFCTIWSIFIMTWLVLFIQAAITVDWDAVIPLSKLLSSAFFYL